MEPTKFDVKKLKYVSARVVSFSLNADELKPVTKELVKSIEFNLKLNKMLSSEKKQFRFTLTVNMAAKMKPKGRGLSLSGSITTEHIFQIDNMDELVQKKARAYQVDTILDQTLTTLTYSTTRGMIAGCFLGTGFENAVLPIVDPRSFIDEKKLNKPKE